jgi:hypothetical protein
MNAKEQYAIVRELREKVLQYDPHAVIAGGAVRDWYLKQPAQDVDFFLNIAQGRSISWNYELLENILGLGKLTPVGKEYFEIREEVAKDDDKEVVGVVGEIDIAFELLEPKPVVENKILGVREIEYKGVKCQFILTKNVWETFRMFPCSLSKFCYEVGLLEIPEFSVKRTDIEEAGALASGVCYYKKGISQKYLDKLKPRYGFQFKEYPEDVPNLWASPIEAREKIILNAIPLEFNV